MANSKWQIANGKRGFTPIKSGFTFIELIIVISIVAILSVIGIAALVAYSRAQILNAAAADIVTMLNVAKSRAQSQVKPVTGTCATSSLDYYRVSFCGLAGSNCVSTGKDYELDVICGNTAISPAIDSRKLPANIMFDTSGTTTTEIKFAVLTGGVTEGDIKIIDIYDNSKIITVDSGGIIFVIE